MGASTITRRGANLMPLCWNASWTRRKTSRLITNCSPSKLDGQVIDVDFVAELLVQPDPAETGLRVHAPNLPQTPLTGWLWI